MFEVFASIVVGAPILLFCLLGGLPLVGRTVSESFTAQATRALILIGMGALLGIVLPQMIVAKGEPLVLRVGEIVNLPQTHFHLRLEFIFDGLSLPMVALSYVLCGTIAAFANNYMHRERGFQRFFFLFAMFFTGMTWAVLAGSIETLFLGWELVGLSSALLVAFFQERANPVTNGLRVWTVYRLSDAALMVAAILLHHAPGEGEFVELGGRVGWPHSISTLDDSLAFWAGLLFVFAAIGKSALWPLSGWLPRAMEGPTPSSAVFYGALSIHLGAFLLLRVSPLLDQSLVLSSLVVAIGILTAIFAAVAGSVQTDVKSGLSFASLVQVGLIVAEIGFGLRYLALVHIIGHACLRTLQLLRAPSILRDYHELGNALGESVSNRLPEGSRTSSKLTTWIYRFGLERGYLDVFWDLFVVRPFVSFFRRCDRMERAWIARLSGATTHQAAEPKSESLTEERP